MRALAGHYGCSFCGGTGIYVETRFRDDEQLIDTATGRALLPWELRALSPERRRALVASGDLLAQPITIEYQVADPNRFCRHCEAGRDREHAELANTPVLHGKRTRTRKNGEDERDAG